MMMMRRHKTDLLAQSKHNNNNENKINKNKKKKEKRNRHCPPITAHKWGNICHMLLSASLLLLLLCSCCQLGRAQQQQQQQQLEQRSEFEAVELPQDNNENDIEFASLDGATQLLPATRQHGVVDVTVAPPATPTLLLTSSGSTSSSSFTELQGGEVLGERILRRSESPYLARDDLEVVRGARLTIEPGVTVEFAPTKGLKVRGVLQAVVSARINFPKYPVVSSVWNGVYTVAGRDLQEARLKEK